MSDSHIERHEIDIYFDATSVLAIKNPDDVLLGLQCDTVQDMRVMLSFEGHLVAALKRTIDRAFDRHPEMQNWNRSKELTKAAEVTFELEPGEIAALDMPIQGQGGFQSFGRRLQEQVDRQSSTVTLSDADLGRIVRHMIYDPDGSFEQRLRTAFGRNLRRIINKD